MPQRLERLYQLRVLGIITAGTLDDRRILLLHVLSQFLHRFRWNRFGLLRGDRITRIAGSQPSRQRAQIPPDKAPAGIELSN